MATEQLTVENSIQTNVFDPKQQNLTGVNGNNGYIMIRKYLINSAVNFLQNSRLKLSTKEEKRTFLFEKGLTSDEIDFAFELAIRRPLNDETIQKELDNIISKQDISLISYSIRMSGQFLLWAGFIYGFYAIYREKIRPYLFETLKNDRPEEKISKKIDELNKQIADLSTNLSIVHEFITTYCRLRDDSSQKIKSELSSIKALLVNRNQFPSIPTIPKWQQQSIINDKNEMANNSE
nr:peroxisomal membrane protein PEX14-like [Dermatophagoides pteronyssinus]